MLYEVITVRDGPSLKELPPETSPLSEGRNDPFAVRTPAPVVRTVPRAWITEGFTSDANATASARVTARVSWVV